MEFAETLEQMRAAGEETRLRILALLSRTDLTVSELTRILGQLQPRVSRHLRILVDAGLVNPYQEGSWRFYRLAGLSPWLAAAVDTVEGAEIAADFKVLEEVRAERAESAKAYFAANAKQWDALRQLHIDDSLIEEALLALAPERMDRFVDFGTGTGRMLSLFAGRYGEGVGYDNSPEMLSAARASLEKEGLRHAGVRRRDILAPDQLPSEEADVVCLHHVLHFLAEPERAVLAAAEVLRPGGCLLIADFAQHQLEELRERHAHRRLGFSSEEIVQYAARSGLSLGEEVVLQPEDDRALTSKIWRLDKPRPPKRPATTTEAILA